MKRFLKMLGYVIVYIILYFAIFKTVQYLWGTVLPQNPAMDRWIKDNPLGMVVLNDVIALPIFSIIVFWLKKESILKVSLFKKISFINIAASVIIGLCMGIFVINFFELPFCQKIPIFEELLTFIYNSGSMLVFIGFVVIGTFFKEILFRGLIFNDMRKAMPLILAVFIHAVIYGALFFNFDPALTIFGTLGNIVVVLVYVLTDSIWGAYTAQAANNVCIFVVRNYTGDFFGDNRIIPLIVSGLLICGSLLYLHFSGKKRVEQKQTYEA